MALKKNKKKKRETVSEATEATETKPRRKSSSWKHRKLAVIASVEKKLAKLAPLINAVKAPGITVDLTNALGATSLLHNQFRALPEDWKPERGATASIGTTRRVGIGSIIKIKEEVPPEQMPYLNAIGGPSKFENAKIVFDDGRSWIVELTTGVKVTIKKNLVTKANPQ